MVVTSRNAPFLFFVILVFFSSGYARAWSPSSAADELAEVIVKKWGRSGASELRRFGGRRQIAQILSAAERKGGKRLSRRVVYYGKTFGVDALTIIKRSPKAVVSALDKIPHGKFRQAFNALEHAPGRSIKLLEKLGPKALGPMMKHPGIGVELLEKLGGHGIWVSRRITTDQTRMLLRHVDDIVKLPRSKQRAVVEAIGKYPAKALDFLEKHPKVLITAASVGTFLALFGGDRPPDVNGPTTTTEWTIKTILEKFRTEIGLIFLAIALGICGWSAVRIWKTWRR